jgi:hypothetical protein
MTSSVYSSTPDVTAKQPAPGPGVSITFQCLGCGHKRSTGGSRGAGIFKRCAPCVESKGIK